MNCRDDDDSERKAETVAMIVRDFPEMSRRVVETTGSWAVAVVVVYADNEELCWKWSTPHPA